MALEDGILPLNNSTELNKILQKETACISVSPTLQNKPKCLGNDCLSYEGNQRLEKITRHIGFFHTDSNAMLNKVSTTYWVHTLKALI